jgi:serine/threonine-protein kinase
VQALAAITPPAATVALPAQAPGQAGGQAAYQATAAMQRTTAMPQQYQQAYVPPPRNRNGLYAALGFLVVVGLVVGGIFLYNALTKDNADSGTPVSAVVPNVVGLDYEVASKTLSDAGLSIEPVALENAEVPENQVYQTDPPANTVVQEGTVVKVFFNPPKQPVPVPDVTGQNLEEAKRIITEAGFVVGAVTSETSDQPKDTVLRTDPAATTSLKVGSPVAIVLSGGPNTQTIPDVANEQVANATATLQGAPFTFVVTTKTEASPTVAKDLVIRTEPAAGGQLAVGGAITLIVSSGPEQVTVDAVVGLTEAVARTTITSKGLQVNVTYVNVPAGDANAGLVISQSIPPGTKVNPTTMIGLQVGRAVAPPSTSTTSTTTTTTSTTTTTTTTTTTPPPPAT